MLSRVWNGSKAGTQSKIIELRDCLERSESQDFKFIDWRFSLRRITIASHDRPLSPLVCLDSSSLLVFGINHNKRIYTTQVTNQFCEEYSLCGWVWGQGKFFPEKLRSESHFSAAAVLVVVVQTLGSDPEFKQILRFAIHAEANLVSA